MKILYVTYLDMSDPQASGSSVRPVAMYQAFLERGHEVYLLEGSCGRGDRKTRKAAVAKAVKWLRENNPDYCYIESSTYPLMFSCDYALIRLLHRKKIPTAYFYRDFYRSFPDLFPRRKGLVNGLKELYLDFLQWRTDRILKQVSLVYFPSEACTRMFRYRAMGSLPPAGELRFLPRHETAKTCIYVGGISERYGLRMLLDSFRQLNRDGRDVYRLILVCRSGEYEAEKEKIGQYPWLEVYHTSGKGLEPLYAKADLGLIPLMPNAYMHLAVAVKLFQYTSYGLPLVSTDTRAMKEIIEKNEFGVTAPYEAEAFAEAIRNLLDDPQKLAYYRSRVEQNMTERNLWVHRVDRIGRDLLGE